MSRLLSLLLLAVSLSGCVFFYGRPPSRVEADQLVGGTNQYIIGAGDSLQIITWKNAELSLTVPVRPDGMISLPLIRDVQAAGRTVPQLTDVLTADFSKVVQQPQVTVILLNALAQSDTSIKVIGEAVQPRIVPYHVGITLIEVMANAGGLTDFADGNRAFLIRYAGGKPTRYHLRIGSLLKSGDMRANIELAPGDVISIPERWY